MDKYYLVGEIINTFGIKGELKIKSDTSFDRFKKGSELFVLQNGEYKKVVVTSHRVHQGFDMVRFDGLCDINLVLEYKGCRLYTLHQEKLTDGRHYYEELIGLDVLVEGKTIGSVKDIRELPNGILLEVIVDGKIKLIPYVSEFVGNITDSTIEIFPIEGLL